MCFQNVTSKYENYNEEFFNSYHLAFSLENKIFTQITQLNPSHVRSKRALINGLGSVLRFITGNLDQSDAERYDTAIETLSKNQFTIKTLMNDQITLLEKSIKTFNQSIQTLAHNQIVLNSRIIQIQDAIKSTELKNIETYTYFLIHTVLTQITTAYQEIYDIFERIEVAITFSKLNIFHNAIIPSHELLKEISFINNHISNNKLPFEPNINNVLLFEKIIEIKSYNKHNQIIFIMEIPLVERENYEYFHMYPLPVKHNHTFQTIFPKSKYLILNEQNYMGSNERCQEITSSTFLCRNGNPSKIDDNAPCEVQMLKFSKNLTKCQIIPIEITDVKIQKLEENQWVIVSPHQVLASKRCSSNKEDMPLLGTFVIETFENCEVQIGEQKLKNFVNTLKTFQKIALPQINNLTYNYKISDKILPIKLDTINLEDVKYISESLNLQKKELDKIQPVVHYNKISVWTIIIYMLIFLLCCYFVYIYIFKKMKQKLRNTDERNLNQKLQDIKLSDSVI